MSENPQKHHYLIAAEIVFKHQEQEQVTAVRVNGVLIQDELGLPQRSLGKAQQIVQLNFMRRMAEEAPFLTVLDVVLMNFVHMGQFTQAEFSKPPEGMKLAEAATAEPVADLDTAVAEAGSKPAAEADTNEA